MAKSPAWQRKEGKNPNGGLNAKGRASAKKQGMNLKPPAPNPKTESDKGRRASFCARMSGMKKKLTGEKATGTVKFFNAMKGFGFIQRDDGQPDAFVHISAVERAGMGTLNEGDKLQFELEVDRRGKYAAVNLSPAS